MASASNLLEDALRCQQAGRLSDAEFLCRQVIASNPQNADAWQLLGELGFQAGNYEAAIICSEEALRLSPLLVAAHVNRARSFKAQNRTDEAIACFRKALELAPNSPDLHCSLGNALLDQEQFGDAMSCYQRALELKPDWPEMYYNIGGALQDQGLLVEASQAFEKALEIRPAYAEAHYNLGVTLRDLGRLDEASAHFREAIQLQPANPIPRCQEAMMLLMRGDFEKGWAEYEWRWKTGQIPERKFVQPPWRGEDLSGRRILLHAEQGLGDTIQFIRYASLLKKFDATVIVECQKRLVPFISSAAGMDQLVAAGSKLPDFDFHAPLLSLPRILRTSLSTIPAEVPYLFADRGLVSLWAEKLRELRGFRIGIAWHGRSGKGAWRQRDIPLESFAPLAAIPGLAFVSLHNQLSAEEASKARELLPLFDTGDEVDQSGAFMDTAAIMKNLDLVITSDTSIPHLAGALGVPVWLVLPFVADWRWLLDRPDSPWYPTMRLFRQQSPGDWGGVFAEIEQALQERVALPR